MVLKFASAFVILCMLLFAKIHFTAPSQVDVLFCPYDMGDSNPIKKLVQECEKQNITYKILPFGKAKEVFENNPHFVKADFPDVKWDREKTLDMKRPYNELNNFAIKQGLALEIEDSSELIEAIKRILSTANRNQSKIKDIGIPKDATKNIVKRIKELLTRIRD